MGIRKFIVVYNFWSFNWVWARFDYFSNEWNEKKKQKPNKTEKILNFVSLWNNFSYAFQQFIFGSPLTKLNIFFLTSKIFVEILFVNPVKKRGTHSACMVLKSLVWVWNFSNFAFHSNDCWRKPLEMDANNEHWIAANRFDEVTKKEIYWETIEHFHATDWVILFHIPTNLMHLAFCIRMQWCYCYRNETWKLVFWELRTNVFFISFLQPCIEN